MFATEKHERRNDSHVDAEIYLRDEKGTLHRVATVTKEKAFWGDRKGQWEPANVNWSAWGAQTPDAALEFARALTGAVDLARRLDAECS